LKGLFLSFFSDFLNESIVLQKATINFIKRMFGFFKKKKKVKPLPTLTDLNNEPLQEGDTVEALRYELGKCKIIKKEDGHFYYESIEKGDQVIWVKMIDASTDLQKVKKIQS
jgi:hypothetical protein